MLRTKFKKLFLFFVSIAITISSLIGSSYAERLGFLFSDRIGDQLMGSADLEFMAVIFDNRNGNYSVLFRGNQTAPLTGDFRLNANVFNPSAGNSFNPGFFSATFYDFHITSQPYIGIQVTGTNDYLRYWNLGNTVASSQIPFGNPLGGGISVSPYGNYYSYNVTAFHSGVIRLPYYPPPISLPPVIYPYDNIDQEVATIQPIVEVISAADLPSDAINLGPFYNLSSNSPPTALAFTESAIYTYSLSSVPEPAAILLLGSGLVGLVGYGRKKF